MQDFITLCTHRRSIRKYTNEPVTNEQLEYILRCALMSPSGKRINPWEFYVTKDEKKIRPLSGCRTYGSAMFQTAGAAIAVAVDASLTDTWQMDAAIAAHNMLLAAEDAGLGACWCQVYGRYTDDQNDKTAEVLVKETLGIPQNLTVVCIISLGYKDEERKNYDIDKLAYAKIHNV